MKNNEISILIVDLAKYFGGANIRVIDMARALDGNYHYAVAVLNGSPLHERLLNEGLNVIPIPYKRSDPRIAWFIAKLIKDEKFTVVDAHNPQSQFWAHVGASFRRNIHKISTIHSAYRYEHGGSLKGYFYESVLHLNRLLGIDYIAVTDAVADYLKSIRIPSKRVHLIHNGINVPTIHTSRMDVDIFQQKGWSDEFFVFIHVARLEPVKGQKFLIEAAIQASKDCPQLRCLLVGDGRLREELEALTKSLGGEDIIHFSGFRSDIPQLLNASNAFCLPSLSEGLPYALLEAASLRVPLLVSNVGGMAEILTHKETGYLVPPSNVEALAEGFRWLINHPAETNQLGQNAYELVATNYSATRMVENAIEVYQT